MLYGKSAFSRASGRFTAPRASGEKDKGPHNMRAAGRLHPLEYLGINRAASAPLMDCGRDKGFNFTVFKRLNGRKASVYFHHYP